MRTNRKQTQHFDMELLLQSDGPGRIRGERLVLVLVPSGAALRPSDNSGGSSGLGVIGARIFSPLFLVGRVPLLKQTKEKSWYPYSNLSTGGPSLAGFASDLEHGPSQLPC